MGTFFKLVFTALTTYFQGAHNNVNRIADLLDAFIQKSKEKFDTLSGQIAQEVQDRTTAIADLASNVMTQIAEVRDSIQPTIDNATASLRARLTLLEANAERLVQFTINPALPSQNIADVLLVAMNGEPVGADKVYVIEFTGDGAGVMGVDALGVPVTVSAGEKYKVRTDANGNVVSAELYKNPTQEIFDGFTSNFDELRQRIANLAADGETMNTETSVHIDAAVSRLNQL
jgi:hypothetical protein